MFIGLQYSRIITVKPHYHARTVADLGVVCWVHTDLTYTFLPEQTTLICSSDTRESSAAVLLLHAQDFLMTLNLVIDFTEHVQSIKSVDHTFTVCPFWWVWLSGVH